jgi:hypothetical protein
MPRLEVFILEMDCQTIFTTLEAPSLRSVTLQTRDTTSDVTHIISSFPRYIQELHLDGIKLENTPGREPILLQHLAFLTLLNVGLYTSLSTYFDMPSLIEVAISNVDDQIPQKDEIQNFIHRVIGPTPTLQRLWLDKLPEEHNNHLSLCSSLKALRITNCNLSGDGSPFFNWLSDIRLLPNLEEVVIQHLQKDTYDPVFDAAQTTAKRHEPSLRLYAGDVCEGLLKHHFRFNPGVL